MLAYNRKRAKGIPKTSSIAIYASVFALIVSVVAVGYQAPQQTTGVANATLVGSDIQNQKTSVDDLVATNLAATLAETANLSVAPNVANLSVALTAKGELAQSNDSIITKPQILQPTNADNRTIVSYTAVAGDTADSIAATYGITKETVKWANNLTSDAIVPGTVLQILPLDGVQYTVKAGDTVASIATKYNVDQSRVILFNDLDEAGITEGAKIILPAGNLPEVERPGYVAPRVVTYGFATNATSSGSNGSNANNAYRASVGNRYTFGYCTWYVYERRAELGRPIGSFWGDASNWANAGASAGFVVNRTPAVGAIMQNGGGAGHVAIVEGIMENGDVVLSEMNYGGGWNQIHRGRVVSAGQASLYRYIH